jgi:SnoaL-like domain
MDLDREMAAAWVERYRQVWEAWDAAGFADLFSEDAVYFEHPVDETVIGRSQLERYLRKERDEEGQASVRMGVPMVDGDQIVGEFWVAMTDDDREATLSGCFVARLDPSSGRCTHYRQYWFELDGHPEPFDGWGRGGQD